MKGSFLASTLVLCAATAMSAYGGFALEAATQSGSTVPVVSSDPAVQHQIEAQLAAPRLDPTAMVAQIEMTGKPWPLKEVLDAVAQAGGFTVRYAADTSGLDARASFGGTNVPAAEALGIVLKGRGLALVAIGPKTAFVYSDTPENREKYTATIRVIPIAKADVKKLAQQLNAVVKPTADGFRPALVMVAEPQAIVVRAIPEQMAQIAKWIADNDK